MAHRQRTAVHDGAGRASDPKSCASCGRDIQWRATWARDWDAVRYCSNACRRRGVTAIDRALEAGILTMLSIAPIIDPLDVAQQIGGDEWLALVEPARRAARRLVAAGEVEIIQGSRVVNPSTAKGAIRVRRPRA